MRRRPTFDRGRHPENPVIQADERWYEQLDPAVWPHVAWRDPWVFADDTGKGWHALITARGLSGPTSQRGVIGHARSMDLANWTVQPPLATPGRFHHLEVPQTTRIGDRWYLLFSVDHEAGGRTYACSAASQLGPFDIAGATPLGSPLLYSGRVLAARDGQPRLMAFHNARADGTFVGELSDPIALHVDNKGRLVTTGTR